MKKLSQLEFLKRCKEKHGERYDYSLCIYNNKRTKIIVICKEHGQFQVYPLDHLVSNCPFCINNNIKSNSSDFINKSKKIHGDKYDYSLVEYINNETKVSIICSIHGEFIQSPNSHLAGKGCPKCGGTKKLSTDEFIKMSKKIHGDKYDYSLVEYVNHLTKIKIICKKHGVFKQTPNSHLSEKGCPICFESKGEMKIRKFLNEKEIKYISQKKFKKCRYKRMLSFDFYLPTKNICIEYDGNQHFKSVDYWGGLKSYENRLIRDKIKNNFCSDNKIKLIRINEISKINEILEKELK